MCNKEGARAIKKIAKKNGVSVHEVREEITKVIRESYQNPIIRKRWEEIFGEGNIPTPEQFIMIMGERINGKI